MMSLQQARSLFSCKFLGDHLLAALSEVILQLILAKAFSVMLSVMMYL